MELTAFHSFWSRPNAVRNEGVVELPDFELLTAVLSALEWKKHNGPIKMITDTPGAEYFDKIGILGLWDGVETSLDEISGAIDPMLFWAAGKLHALKSMKMPAVMLDTDLIIWKKLTGVEAYDIVAAHDEDLFPDVYPDPVGFGLKGGYHFPHSWDFHLKAANTAFLYIKDETFRDRYVEEALRFMSNVNFDGLNPVTAMCFAEQRILPMEAKAHNRTMGYLMELGEADEQNFITHTWGYKGTLSENEEAREAFCRRCVERIKKEFPEILI